MVLHTSATNNDTTLATSATNNQDDESMNKRAQYKWNWNFNSKLDIQQLENIISQTSDSLCVINMVVISEE